MNLFYFKIPAGYKNMTDNETIQADNGRKIWGGYITSISVKNFNFDEFILKFQQDTKI